MNKKTKSIIETVIYIIIIIALAIGTPKALCYILNTKYPVASITSGSMWPALKKGDIVFMKGIDKSELKVDDIIVYKNSSNSKQIEGFTIHRIVKLNEKTLKTKGDANNVSDPLIRYEEVVGKTVNLFGKPLRIPKLGSLTIWASGLKK